jgi:hypothetical protein
VPTKRYELEPNSPSQPKSESGRVRRPKRERENICEEMLKDFGYARSYCSPADNPYPNLILLHREYSVCPLAHTRIFIFAETPRVMVVTRFAIGNSVKERSLGFQSSELGFPFEGNLDGSRFGRRHNGRSGCRLTIVPPHKLFSWIEVLNPPKLRYDRSLSGIATTLPPSSEKWSQAASWWQGRGHCFQKD